MAHSVTAFSSRGGCYLFYTISFIRASIFYDGRGIASAIEKQTFCRLLLSRYERVVAPMPLFRCRTSLYSSIFFDAAPLLVADEETSDYCSAFAACLMPDARCPMPRKPDSHDVTQRTYSLRTRQ